MYTCRHRKRIRDQSYAYVFSRPQNYVSSTAWSLVRRVRTSEAEPSPSRAWWKSLSNKLLWWPRVGRTDAPAAAAEASPAKAHPVDFLHDKSGLSQQVRACTRLEAAHSMSALSQCVAEPLAKRISVKLLSRKKLHAGVGHGFAKSCREGQAAFAGPLMEENANATADLRADSLRNSRWQHMMAYW